MKEFIHHSSYEKVPVIFLDARIKTCRVQANRRKSWHIDTLLGLGLTSSTRLAKFLNSRFGHRELRDTIYQDNNFTKSTNNSQNGPWTVSLYPTDSSSCDANKFTERSTRSALAPPLTGFWTSCPVPTHPRLLLVLTSSATVFLSSSSSATGTQLSDSNFEFARDKNLTNK